MTRFWDLAPNWRQSYEVTHEFRTDIITSRSGREQRNALRAEPRKSLSFLSTCSADRYRVMQRQVSVGQGTAWYVGDVTVAVHTADVVPAGADTVEVDDVPFWLVEDAPVVLVSGSLHVLATVSEIDGSEVTFDGAFDVAWPAGTAVVPACLAYLDVGLSGSVKTNNLVELMVNFTVDPGTGLVEPPSSPDVVFNGREVFLKRPNWRESVTSKLVSGREDLDYGRGPLAHFLPVEFPEGDLQATYVGKSVAEIEAIRKFFVRMKGQQGEFYMPSWMQDIEPKQDLVNGQATITVKGTEFADAYGDDTVHRALVVIKTDGTMLYRKVSAVAISGSDSRITCTTNWPSNIPLASISAVSWMPVWRLLSDSLTIEWVTSGVAQTVLNMKTLEDLPGE